MREYSESDESAVSYGTVSYGWVLYHIATPIPNQTKFTMTIFSASDNTTQKEDSKRQRTEPRDNKPKTRPSKEQASERARTTTVTREPREAESTK